MTEDGETQPDDDVVGCTPGCNITLQGADALKRRLADFLLMGITLVTLLALANRRGK